jgi:hypothetical protein
MYDTVNFWINRVNVSGSPFDVLPCLSEITERQNEKSGYSCTGKAGDYTVSVYESGISLKGSLAKYFLPSNIYTLKRKDAQHAIEQLSDQLHIDLTLAAKITRMDISTVLYTKRPPADYFPYLGDKPYFNRLQSTPDTLYYNQRQRQIVFYDKSKEAIAKGVQVPEILQSSNLLRYELRYIKRLNSQLNTDLTVAKLYDTEFYRLIVQRWYKEFKTIQKLKEQSFMTDKIPKTPNDAKEALLAVYLQEKGQSYVDEYLNELKAKNAFPDKKYYSRLKADLNKILATPKGEQSDLIKELETQIFDIARYAR